MRNDCLQSLHTDPDVRVAARGQCVADQPHCGVNVAGFVRQLTMNVFQFVKGMPRPLHPQPAQHLPVRLSKIIDAEGFIPFGNFPAPGVSLSGAEHKRVSRPLGQDRIEGGDRLRHEWNDTLYLRLAPAVVDNAGFQVHDLAGELGQIGTAVAAVDREPHGGAELDGAGEVAFSPGLESGDLRVDGADNPLKLFRGSGGKARRRLGLSPQSAERLAELNGVFDPILVGRVIEEAHDNSDGAAKRLGAERRFQGPAERGEVIRRKCCDPRILTDTPKHSAYGAAAGRVIAVGELPGFDILQTLGKPAVRQVAGGHSGGVDANGAAVGFGVPFADLVGEDAQELVAGRIDRRDVPSLAPIFLDPVIAGGRDGERVTASLFGHPCLRESCATSYVFGTTDGFLEEKWSFPNSLIIPWFRVQIPALLVIEHAVETGGFRLSPRRMRGRRRGYANPAETAGPRRLGLRGRLRRPSPSPSAPPSARPAPREVRRSAAAGRRIAFVGAMPPCTQVANSGARDFKVKGPRMLTDAIELFNACDQLGAWSQAPYWVENPAGVFPTHIRKWDYTFQPWQYGDNESKQTCLWTGNGFVMPPPLVAEKPADVRQKSLFAMPTALMAEKPAHIRQTCWRMPPSEDRAAKRAITPAGFARAVFEANAPLVRRAVA